MFADSLGLVVTNVGWELTLLDQGMGSCVDVTFTSDTATRQIQGLNVRKNVENMSDHHHFCFSYLLGRALLNVPRANMASA